jgi:hypothetical protein
MMVRSHSGRRLLILCPALLLGLAACGGLPQPNHGRPSGTTVHSPSSTPQTPPSPVGTPAGTPTSGSGVSNLLVDSFQVIEFQYDSLPGHYFYAPRMHVSSDGDPLTVEKLELAFPDGTPAPAFCSTGLPVSGAGRDLVGELYGDYEFSIDYADGHRAGPGSFTLTMTYVDAGGQRRTLSATGEATPGGLPTTYTGGTSSMNPGSCPSGSSASGGSSISTLVLDGFEMLELQYDSVPGHYFYAPQIRVTSVEGPLTVKELDLWFPDGTGAPSFCSTGMAVTSPGRDLVGELYGDWELTIDYGDGHRADPGSFHLRILYVDTHGRTGTVSATGEAVPGGLPTTYTGGASSMNPGGC